MECPVEEDLVRRWLERVDRQHLECLCRARRDDQPLSHATDDLLRKLSLAPLQGSLQIARSVEADLLHPDMMTLPELLAPVSELRTVTEGGARAVDDDVFAVEHVA